MDYVESVPLRNQLDALRHKLERIREIASNPDPYDPDSYESALFQILDVIG